MRKRSLLILLIFALLAQSLGLASAVLSEMPETITYTGDGVVSRVTPPSMTRALISELNVAYIEADDPYLTVGEESTWTAHATGGDGVYRYAFGIYHRSGTEGTLSRLEQQTESDANSFSYTIAAPGHYVIVLDLYDTSGAYIRYQSQIFETVNAADYDNTATVAGKVKALAAQCLLEAGKSDYSRALWMHDWLINNAEYDSSLSIFYSDGVLLQGRGVCQSYALAYQMLLREIGIDSIYITGYGVTSSGNVSHGWNLVKLGGEWYHVDCTWDDPLPNGNEHHDYFGLTDEQMAKDHIWASDWAYMPRCTATQYNYMRRTGAYLVANQSELEAAVAEMIEKREGYARFIYTGSESGYVMTDHLFELLDAAEQSSEISMYTYDAGTTSNLLVAVGYDGDYPATLESPAQILLGTERVMLDVGESFSFDLSYGPDRVLTWVDIGDNKKQMQWVDLSDYSFDFVWSSSNADAAEVSQNGELTAIAPGTAEITVSCGDVSTSCAVKVFPASDASLVLPAAIKNIEREAFAGCDNVTSIEIPYGSLLSIGERAFAECGNLKTIVIPSTVYAIAKDAFGGNAFTRIICQKDSAAHIYAVEHNMPYTLQ